MSARLGSYQPLHSSESLPSTINEFRQSGNQYLTKDISGNFDHEKAEALRRKAKPFPLRVGGHSKDPTDRRNRAVEACLSSDKTTLRQIGREINAARFGQEDRKEWGVGVTLFSLPGMITGAGPAMLGFGIPMIVNAKRDIARDEKTLKIIQENT